MSRAKGVVVAIDGPAGAGKSTVARLVARALRLRLIDTGALYRAVALAARDAAVSWEDGPALGALASGLDLTVEQAPDGGCRVLLGRVDPGTELRTPEISRGASAVSKHPEVRAALLDLQRRLGRTPPGAVLEGRDIGTVVFPDAEHKFFLTADEEERARRRYEEIRQKGLSTGTLEDTLREQRARDAQDTARAASPLRAAAEATVVDTTGLGVEEVVEKIVSAVSRSENS